MENIMHLIVHRRNKLSELKKTKKNYGVEVDIRSNGSELITNHDAFLPGDLFEEWLNYYAHGTLILNVKEEGLENRIIELMKKFKINDYFFLDQSFPFLVKWSNYGLSKIAVRVSEYESIKTALTLSGKVDWVWIDCFTHLALTNFEAAQLKIAGFKLCLVSPELQGKNPEIEIPRMWNLLCERDISIDAVCTKHPNIWQSLS